MPADVRENWSDQQLVCSSILSSWTAQRGFTVAGVTNETDAANASAEFAIGTVHPRSTFLRVATCTPEQKGYGLWHVILKYGYGATSTPSNDPLNQKPRLRWRLGSETVQVDMDADGNPLLNSAGDAFSPSPNDEVISLHLSYTRNEPFFDIQKALQYSNKINVNAFTVRGGGIVAPGQCLCRSIQPLGEVVDGADFVPIEYEFEFRAGRTLDSDGLRDGFKHRLLDQGLRAYYYSGTTLKIGDIYTKDSTTGNKTRVTTDVRLDGYGATWDDGTYLVTQDLIDSADQSDTPDGAIAEITGFAAFLKYKRKATIDFNGLGL